MMSKYLITKIILFGFFTWLIPFAVSFLFFTQSDDVFMITEFFKSIMVLIVSITVCYFLFNYFKFIENDFIKNGIIIGLSWFGINIILDTITLIPMMNINFEFYFMSIGLRYSMIPIISITIGYLLGLKNKTITDINL